MASSAAEIWVLAGVNGAGKSSVGGAMLRRAGQSWYDPDRAAVELRASSAGFDAEESNALAWQKGFDLLTRAVAERRNFLFETTLGGNTITRKLIEGAKAGIRVRVWYCGLETVELHLARVQRRVHEGGHDIPEAMIRQRYDSSRMNLIRLLPHLTELRLLDNSVESKNVRHAKPRVLMHLLEGELLEVAAPSGMPDWAKPIVAAALT